MSNEVGSQGYDVQQEVGVVVVANAVVDVRAVVVEPFNSPISDVAVAAARGQDYFAFWADV